MMSSYDSTLLPHCHADRRHASTIYADACLQRVAVLLCHLHACGCRTAAAFSCAALTVGSFKALNQGYVPHSHVGRDLARALALDDSSAEAIAGNSKLLTVPLRSRSRFGCR